MTALLDVVALHRQFHIQRQVKPLDFLRRGARKGPALLHAVDEVSFSIGRGETVGLVGESGCGKSTLVRLITRLLDPTDGAIALDGLDIGAIPASRFGRTPHRRRIQMVFQDATDSLNPRYTAFDSIAAPLRRLSDLRGGNIAARVREVAEMVGLAPELLGRFPHQLSGGQKARVGIARAIAVEPELLVLDEPTSALDVSVQVLILHLLEDLKRKLGMSYLFVSHDLNVVRLLCDRVLVMYLGRIVESGPAKEVFANPAHPYTRALVSTIPALPGTVPGDRLRLSGEPMSPIDPDPNVCRFASRCPRVAERCRTQMPLIGPPGGARQVACHFPEAQVAVAAAASIDEPPLSHEVPGHGKTALRS